MYIYWEELSCAYMRKIPDNENWSLYSDYNEYGEGTLNLQIGEEKYCVYKSEYWTSGEPDLDDFEVVEYFAEVVKTVFKMIAEENPECIDLMEIQEQVMEPFWKRWKEKGYVGDN